MGPLKAGHIVLSHVVLKTGHIVLIHWGAESTGNCFSHWSSKYRPLSLNKAKGRYLRTPITKTIAMGALKAEHIIKYDMPSCQRSMARGYRIAAGLTCFTKKGPLADVGNKNNSTPAILIIRSRQGTCCIVYLEKKDDINLR